MANWKKVHEVVLDMNDPWKHKILLKDKDGFLLDKIEINPNDSMEALMRATNKMQEAKKENRDG